MQISLFFFSLAGFFVSLYIFLKISKKQKLYCPIFTSCDEVLSSKYGYLFGPHNSFIGIFFYSFFFFLSFFSFPSEKSIGFIVSFCGVFVSLYLAYIQYYKLKKFCDYCIFSLILNLLIWNLFFWILISRIVPGRFELPSQGGFRSFVKQKIFQSLVSLTTRRRDFIDYQYFSTTFFKSSLLFLLWFFYYFYYHYT